MKQASALGLAVAAFVLSACSNDAPPPEPAGSTESHLSGSGGGGSALHDCIDSIDAPVGSADWRAQLQECVSDAVGSAGSGGVGGGGAAPPPSGDDDDDGASGGQSCTSGISCVNGSCQCSSGPNQGQSCDGSSASGADSCSVLCHFCQ